MDAKSPSTRPVQVFRIPCGGQVYSLATYKSMLLVGTVATVTAYVWSKNEITKKSWEVKLSSATNKDSLEQAEVNSMWLDKASSQLFAGCGDNVII